MSNDKEDKARAVARAIHKQVFPNAWPPNKVWRSICQIVTVARFRRPVEPKRCNIHAYHVWRWQTIETDPNETPLEGMKCQCGCLTWTPRKAPR